MDAQEANVCCNNGVKDHNTWTITSITKTELSEELDINEIDPITAMAFEEALTSPTELLPPKVFPHNVHKKETKVTCSRKANYKVKNIRVRCVRLVILLLLLSTCVMTGLFIWKTIHEKSNKLRNENHKEKCFARTKPVRLKSIPINIMDYANSWKEEIKKKMRLQKQSVFVANIVYYDQVIWEVKFKLSNETNEITEEKKEKLFPVASLTKVITSLLSYKLYNYGIIGLDDPLTKYEPQFWVRNPFKNDNGSGITIRELITYSSGLSREAPCYIDNLHNYCPHNTSYILQQLRNDKSHLLYEPGSSILYGNLPFALAGHVVTKNYPRGYEKCVQDQIFEPLGMKRSTFELKSLNEMYLPSEVNKRIPKFKNWGWLNPAGGLVTTVHDLAQLEIGLFNNSNNGYLRPAILDEFFTPAYIFSNGKKMVGSSWDIYFKKGYLYYEKSGYIYGYSSSMHLLPDLRLAVNILSTSQKAHVTITKRIPELFHMFHEHLIKMPQNKHEVPTSNAEQYVGVYYTDELITLHNVPVTVSISKKENATHSYLQFRILDYKFPLIYCGDHTFKMIRVKMCKNFFLGVNGEKLYFKKPLTPHNKIDEFRIHGVHLKGIITFKRKHDSNDKL
ncbi:beta-lactamase-like protein 1 isoform X2 [Xenia sp. Carnegie-2017]|nr:beta-lactamase-like protein 1 isoform X2 [Xenia sp. Carnegie-2017]